MFIFLSQKSPEQDFSRDKNTQCKRRVAFEVESMYILLFEVKSMHRFEVKNMYHLQPSARGSFLIMILSSSPVSTFPPGASGPAGDQNEVDKVISGMGYTDVQKLGQGGMGMAFKCTSRDGSLRVVKARFCFSNFEMVRFYERPKKNKET